MSEKYDPFYISNTIHRGGKDMSVVGAYLPAELAERLALMALVHRQSRSLWVVKAINYLLKSQGISSDEATTILAERIIAKWDYLKTTAIGAPQQEVETMLQEYIDSIKTALHRRGVSSTTIETILKKTRLT